MNIDLYYVEGISRIDTPSFNTKNHIGTIQDQEDFFLTKKVKTIENTFYPPYYRNQIKFDKADLVITDNVNYLSFVYGNKTYYYFIDAINYTSTGVILLDISMDTIQTFMFDIYISSGIIKRKFINRWTPDNKINRNYKRENVSNGLFTRIGDKQILNGNTNRWLVVGKYTKSSKDNTTDTRSPCYTIDLKDNSQSYEYQIPYALKFALISGYKYAGSVDEFFAAIGFIASSAYIAETRDMFICPFNPFNNCLVFNDNNREVSFNADGLYNIFHHDYLNFNDMHGEYRYCFHTDVTPYRSYVQSQYVNFGFVKNTTKGVLYNTSYSPVMLDENYIQFIFGTNTTNTTFPLFELSSPGVYCKYGIDLSNGARMYYISSDNSSTDKFNTLVVDMNILSLDLKNDAWANYISANKNRWSMLTASALLGASETMVRVGSSSKYASADIDAILANPNSYTPKRYLLKAQAKRDIESIKDSSDDTTGQMMLAGSMSRAIGGIVNQVLTENNLKHTPPTVKQTGQYSVSSISKSAFIYWQNTLVNDYYQCAQYYHRNGYLVDEYITQVSNIFNSVKNRYYFDVLKMSIPEVHLHNVIEDEETVGLIEERLEQGLRLWNVLNRDVIMGDFTYDNVEIDYLS